MLPNTAVSRLGMFRILAYTPHEGEPGVPITVHTYFHNLYPTRRVFLRLVIGSKAIGTEIRRMSEGENETWRLEGAIPPFHIHKASSPTIAVTVQAVDSDNNILDTITFGQFTYWDSGGSSRSTESISPTLTVPAQRPGNLDTNDARRERPIVPANPPRSRQSSGSGPPQQLLRRREAADAADKTAERAVLEFLTPLEEAGSNLTEDEKKAGRRLVRFTRKQDRHRLRISCQAISQEEYDERAVVVSCIYRASADATYVTSVDIIYLLQYFVQDHFSVEEKNRIRRNLEGFRPVTVSKSRAGSEAFFQQIMEFPMPKPRNIEKDVKVFTWDTLGPALDKIISKYSLFTVNKPSVPSQPSSRHSPVAPAEPPSFVGYPTAQPQEQEHNPPSLYPPAALSSFSPPRYPGGAYTPPSMDMPMADLGMGMDHSMIGSQQGSSLALATSRLIEHVRASRPGSQDADLSAYHAMSHHGGGGAQDLYHGPIDGAMPTFDSMEFQTLREHNNAGSSTQYL
ncbi:hypothetical protein FA95DRAFT_1570125 [Auriscalpium vulgare]|uniref:Uncharacterized protein n=1 Tax=Auriscalpium vulgare TaxID=40419 RepID=A0ACB8S4P3_9AGAM|nr:hypothetical protein FA95DRAFT_1570125 [Auriscalpium vulgare]